jgi:hypothetical protein
VSNATLSGHPIPIDCTVTVFFLRAYEPPLIEGTAVIIAAIPNIPHCYDVRFARERQVQRRLVHPGAWQSDPLGMLAALIDHWRVAIAPELIAPATLFNCNPKPATSRRKTP